MRRPVIISHFERAHVRLSCMLMEKEKSGCNGAEKVMSPRMTLMVSTVSPSGYHVGAPDIIVHSSGSEEGRLG